MGDCDHGCAFRTESESKPHPAWQVLNKDWLKVVEAVGIEQPAIRLLSTILERFRGQVSPKTPSNNTNKTR